MIAAGRYVIPKFLESKLKKEYGAKSAIPYKIMNAKGLMHGSQETEKGREMERAHDPAKVRRDMVAAAYRKVKGGR